MSKYIEHLDKEATDILDRIMYLEECELYEEAEMERQRLLGTMYGKDLDYNDVEEVLYVK
jgi:hypothetical protein